MAFFAILWRQRDFLTAIEPVIFALAIYWVTTFLKFEILETRKFNKLFSGLPRNLDWGNFKELDVRSVLKKLDVPYHDIIDSGFRAGMEKGFAALQDQKTAMMAVADRNTFFVGFPGHPFPRVRFFQSEKPMNSSMAYYGFLRPTIVLFRDKIDNLTWFQRFEILHELGHGTMKGQYMYGFFYVHLQFLILTTILLMAVVPVEDYIYLCPIFLAYFSFVFWLNQGKVDDESRADSFALQNMTSADIQKLYSAVIKYNIPQDPSLSEGENVRRRLRLLKMIEKHKKTSSAFGWFDTEIDASQTGLVSNATEAAKYSRPYRIINFFKLVTLLYTCGLIHGYFDRDVWWVLVFCFALLIIFRLLSMPKEQLLSVILRVGSLRDQVDRYFSS
ncbi:hypothetical protein [Roseibium polysiphoniae]|uniref:Peptidase M48 domain-containing protein n=1 Tax=Roseibium polysiphoniae TaxID=2571221 RepID=A0ABR9C686_9HYPH|nr:hypothetical protein [Roseibium polysiphoniae]MBD8875424.1 hypothetical protein [Roseibium polysiphoniae]